MTECIYQGCNYEVNTPNNSEYCLFHSSSDTKGVNDQIFETKLRDHFLNIGTEINCEGYIFHIYINFMIYTTDNRFNKFINFKNCKFEGSQRRNLNTVNGSISINLCINLENAFFSQGVDFSGSDFTNGCDFMYIKIRNKIFNFNNSKFHESVYFDGLIIENSDVYFENVNFLGELSSFNNCSFTSNDNFTTDIVFTECIFNNVSFNGSKFISNEINFDNSSFIGGYSNFNNLNVLCDRITFKRTKFINSGFYFENNILKVTKVNFNSAEFNNEVSFSNIEFLENKSSKLKDYSVNFTYVKFKKGVEFNRVIFNCGITYFSHSCFHYCNIFHDLKFLNNVYFDCIEFGFDKLNDRSEIDFWKTEFKGRGNTFKKSIFCNVKFSFSNSIIDNDINFDDLKLLSNSEFIFQKIFFSNNASFNFRNPIIESSNSKTDNYKKILIKYLNIEFPAFRTIFEGIKNKNKNISLIFDFAIIFRYCSLENVFFNNNNISLFSFYKSFFEKTIFTLNEWIGIENKFKLERNNLLFEDIYLYNKHIVKDKNIKDEFEKNYYLEDLKDYSEIMAMYRKMKTAFDQTKDYVEAGKFYFNEHEMRRLYYKSAKGISSCFKWLVYYFYKITCGYGEKPFRALCWLFASIIILSIVNLFSGFNFKTDSENNYKILYKIDTSQIFDIFKGDRISDYFLSIEYTLSRAIPPGYLPFDKSDFSTFNFLGSLLSIFTSVFLIYLIVMFGVGVKRHFRRF